MNIKLTKAVYEKLKAIADKLDMPMAQVVNMLCNKYTNKS